MASSTPINTHGEGRISDIETAFRPSYSILDSLKPQGDILAKVLDSDRGEDDISPRQKT